MRVNFFEEYPEKGDLQKAELVDFPSTVFIAADSIEEYEGYKAELKEINSDLEPAYWAILDNSYWAILDNSYWVSPFADTEDLKNLFGRTSSIDDKVFLDLELPFLRPHLFVKNILKFRKNKDLIRNFIKDSEAEIVTGEYPPAPVLRKLFRALGVSYKSKEWGHTRYLMYYTSMLPNFLNRLLANSVEKTAKNDEKVAVGLGTIERGVLKVEPILSPENLEKDLRRMEEADVEEVAIFRLGGLDKDYIEVLNRFAEQ